MKTILKSLTLGFVISALALVGCSSLPESLANSDKNKLGILIMAGEGFNPIYDDPKDQKVRATWLDTSKKLAEYLETEIEQEHHTDAEAAVNLNSTIDSNTFIAQQFAQKRVDGLIQVRISHIKNASENTIYLKLAYNAVHYGKNQQGGDTMIIGKGIEEKYTLVGVNFEGSKTPLNYFTHDFIRKLSQKGFIAD
ncbi:hypothetical protein [Methylophilus sp. TWE2]|uniref:hypothetical protein n=1 Tax=Methylophilus sp. TWE2 TaxID=1662285 RepID=UPI0006709C3F|nr:hypothetical protein [Methylophilus sp. TWE2]AKR42223.1 hypothetical protein ACJ67_01350 [Methylophilus sp. TWE2]